MNDDAPKTLNSMIDVLQFNITLLSRFADIPDEDEDEEELKTWLTTADINGLCLLLNSLKSAAEVCYAQCDDAQIQTEWDKEPEQAEAEPAE